MSSPYRSLSCLLPKPPLLLAVELHTTAAIAHVRQRLPPLLATELQADAASPCALGRLRCSRAPPSAELLSYRAQPGGGEVAVAVPPAAPCASPHTVKEDATATKLLAVASINRCYLSVGPSWVVAAPVSRRALLLPTRRRRVKPEELSRCPPLPAPVAVVAVAEILGPHRRRRTS